MVSLQKQDIIDYIYSTDSDLSVLGGNVITNLRQNGSCWYTPHDAFLQIVLPNQLNLPNNISITTPILKHIVSFLGNDFLKRNPGNSFQKLSLFIHSITDAGNLRPAHEVFTHILTNTLIPSNCSDDTKDSWNETKKLEHLKTWKESMEMFEFGPVFKIHSNDSSLNPKDALRLDRYQVTLDTMNTLINLSGDPWILDECDRDFYDKQLLRTYLVGFHPMNDLLHVLKSNTAFVFDEKDLEGVSLFLKKCLALEVWCKNGECVIPLSPLTDSYGNELFHGSVIDFVNMPIRYHISDSLEFWLQSRQIKSPKHADDKRNLVEVVWKQLGDRLKSIAKVLMKGTSGYCSPQILQLKQSHTQATYKIGDELLLQLHDIFPNITDVMFTSLFGKRNGSRIRVLKHLYGGSFNIQNIQSTLDLTDSAGDSKNLLVISGCCAPSYKLKEKSKEKFYELKLVIELDDNSLFKRFLDHPFTTCSCPNGCILCSHLGAFILILLLLKNYDHCEEEHAPDAQNILVESFNADCPIIVTSFETIRHIFPTPVNELMVHPMIASFAHPTNPSSESEQTREVNRSRKHYAKKVKHKNKFNSLATILKHGDEELIYETRNAIKKLGVSLPEENDELEEYSVGNILDASDTPILPVVSRSKEWLYNIKKLGVDMKGNKLKTADGVTNALIAEVEYRTSDLYCAKKFMIQEKFLKLSSRFEFTALKGGSSDIENNDYGNEGDAQKKKKLPYPEPIIIPVLKATTEKRHHEQHLLGRQIDFQKIPLDRIMKDVELEDVLH